MTAGSEPPSTTRARSRSRLRSRALSRRRAGRPSGRSSSFRTPRRSTGLRTRRMTGVTAPGTRSSRSIRSGRRTQPSISTSRAQALRIPSRSTRLLSYAGGSSGSAAAQHATGCFRTASSSQRRRPGPKCGPFSPRESPESTSRRSPLRSTGPSTTPSTTRPTGWTSTTSRVLRKCARACCVTRMPAQPTSSTSPRARETSPGRWTERSIARSHPPLRSSSARPAGHGSQRSVVGCTASTHARARAIRTSKRPPTSLGSRRHWSTYAPEKPGSPPGRSPASASTGSAQISGTRRSASSSLDAGVTLRAPPGRHWAIPMSVPDLWDELASLRGERGARPAGPWLEEGVAQHLETSRAELERRLERMAEAASGRIFPLPPVRKEDLPS